MCAEVEVCDPINPRQTVKATMSWDTMSSKTFATEALCDETGTGAGEPDIFKVWGMNDQGRGPTSYSQRKVNMGVLTKKGMIIITPTQ
uniref:Uncharacterized protein n=1 Tax=Ditylenchus dipsaci TaxID=166011 RepID=A0A915CSG5_9BILA